MSRILLFGRSGQLGFELNKSLAPLGKLTAFDRSELDISDLAKLQNKIAELRPDIIINAAAYTAVDKAESDEIACFAANVSAPATMAREAAKIGALLVHYSTDYVFDGTKNTPYTEEDTPNPINYYGFSKLMGEEAIRYSGCAHLIFRTSWVYHTSYGVNFYRTMVRLAKEREELRVVADQRGVPNDAVWLANKTASILTHPLDELKQKSGIYHLSGEGVTTWYEFACSIIGGIGESERKCSRIIPITTAEYPALAKRPLFSALDGSKLREAFGV